MVFCNSVKGEGLCRLEMILVSQLVIAMGTPARLALSSSLLQVSGACEPGQPHLTILGGFACLHLVTSVGNCVGNGVLREKRTLKIERKQILKSFQQGPGGLRALVTVDVLSEGHSVLNTLQ